MYKIKLSRALLEISYVMQLPDVGCHLCVRKLAV